MRVNVKKQRSQRSMQFILRCHRFKWGWFLFFFGSIFSKNCKIFSFKSSIEIFIIWKCLKFPNVKCFTFLQIRTIQGSLLTFQMESFKKVKVKIRASIFGLHCKVGSAMAAVTEMMQEKCWLEFPSLVVQATRKQLANWRRTCNPNLAQSWK